MSTERNMWSGDAISFQRQTDGLIGIPKRMLDENPWMARHLACFRTTLASWREARRANRSWRHLSKYGKVVAWIFHHVKYLPPPVQRLAEQPWMQYRP